MVLFGRVTGTGDIATKLEGIAQHGTDVGVVIILLLLQPFAAMVLAVTLYAITREEDPDLAMLGMVCRIAEGVIGGAGVATVPALVWLATATRDGAADKAAVHALGTYLLRSDMALTATFFAAGSAFFSCILLRGRMIPIPLAWLGVVASVLLVICLPLQLAGFLHGLILQLIWLPMLAFEVPVALWLLIKGAAMPVRMRTA